MDLRDSRQPNKTLDRSGVEELYLAISLHPQDSVSNIGSANSNVSVTSGRSKASSARLKASAKKAALSVEAAALKKRQDMQMEALLLRQRKESFKIEVELAKAEAEEQVYSHREEQIPSTPPSQPPPPSPHETDERTVEASECGEQLPLTPASHLPTSTPCQIKEERNVEAPETHEQVPTSNCTPRLVKEEKPTEVPEIQDPPSKEENSVEIPKQHTEENQDVNCAPLNPHAPVWTDDKHFISMNQRESSEEGLFERHLDLSQKNVSHMVEVQKLQQQQNQQLQELLHQQQQQTLAMTLPEPEIDL